jgi:hypothetical protein
VSTDPDECVATGVDLGTPIVDDNCDVAAGYPQNDAPTEFPLGETIVTWTVADTAGLTATCQQSVTVVDSQPPTISGCPDGPVVRIAESTGCKYILEDFGVTAIDNCDDELDETITVDGQAAEVGVTELDPGTYTVRICFEDDAAPPNEACCEFELEIRPAPWSIVTCCEDAEPILATGECGTNGVINGAVSRGDGLCFGEVPDYCAMDCVVVDNPCDVTLWCWQDPEPGTMLPPGVHTITMTIDDDDNPDSDPDDDTPPQTCTFDVEVMNHLWLEYKGCLDDPSMGNRIPVSIYYQCAPLVQLVFEITFDPTLLEYGDCADSEEAFWYGYDHAYVVPGGPPLGNPPYFHVAAGDADQGRIIVYIDDPGGTAQIYDCWVGNLLFRPRPGVAPGTEIDITIGQVYYATDESGLDVPIFAEGLSLTLGECLWLLDVDGNGCVDDLDGLLIYRALKYGDLIGEPVFEGLVPIVPPWVAEITCFAPVADAEVVANVADLLAMNWGGPVRNGGVHLLLNADYMNSAGGVDPNYGPVNPARDGVYFYRVLGGLIGVPSGHGENFDTWLAEIEAYIQGLMQEVDCGDDR